MHLFCTPVREKTYLNLEYTYCSTIEMVGLLGSVLTCTTKYLRTSRRNDCKITQGHQFGFVSVGKLSMQTACHRFEKE